MKKSLTVMVALMMSIQAHAISKSQLVGDWRCTTHETTDEGKYITVTLDTINPDGTMSQLWEVASYDNRGRLEGVEYLTIKNRWSVKGNQFKISNWTLIDHMAYDKDKSPLDAEYQAVFKESWQRNYATPYSSTIKFTNKDTFIFPDSGERADITCVRLTPTKGQPS